MNTAMTSRKRCGAVAATGLVVLTMLLAGQPVPALAAADATTALSSMFSGAAIQAFRWGVDAFSRARPTSIQLLNELASKREKRGDHKGAERLKQLQGWTSYMGLSRGLPVLAADLMGKRHIATSAFSTVYKAWSEVEKKAATEGWPDALISQQALLARTVRRVFGQLGEGIKDGATRRLLDELMFEIKSDKHLAGDALSALLGKNGLRSDVIDTVQGLFNQVRSAFPASGEHAAPTAHSKAKGDGNFYDEL